MSILRPFCRLIYMWPKEQSHVLVSMAQRAYEGCLSSFPLSFLRITGRYLLCLKGGLFIFFVFQRIFHGLGCAWLKSRFKSFQRNI